MTSFRRCARMICYGFELTSFPGSECFQRVHGAVLVGACCFQQYQLSAFSDVIYAGSSLLTCRSNLLRRCLSDFYAKSSICLLACLSQLLSTGSLCVASFLEQQSLLQSTSGISDLSILNVDIFWQFWSNFRRRIRGGPATLQGVPILADIL